MSDIDIVQNLVRKIEEIERKNGQDIFATEQNQSNRKNVVKAILDEVDKVIEDEN